MCCCFYCSDDIFVDSFVKTKVGEYARVSLALLILFHEKFVSVSMVINTDSYH